MLVLGCVLSFVFFMGLAMGIDEMLVEESIGLFIMLQGSIACIVVGAINISAVRKHNRNIKEMYDARAAERTQIAALRSAATEEIEKYHHLLQIGAITQEEFDAKKKQLLGL